MRRFAKSSFAIGCGAALLAAAAAGTSERPARAATIAADKLPEPEVGAGLPAAESEYLRRLHAHVHRRWADNFLRLVGESLPASNPLNTEPGRTAEVDVTITPDGQLVASTITKGSGFPGFDDAIVEILRDSVPFPRPVEAVRSDDDKLHAHWVFARDQRRCAGLSVVRVNDPLEIAIPKLMRSGRQDEIVSRVAAARAVSTPAEPMMTMLAQEWIAQSINQPWASVRMARNLAERGEPKAVAWLKNALKRPELAREAGEALSAVKVPVCPLVKPALDGANWTDQQTAALALAGSTDAACAPGLVKLFENAKAHPDARVAAAAALGNLDDEGARKSLAAAAKDEKNDAVRGAAMLAQIRPNAGRGKVLWVVQFIRDPSPDIRAASVAGVVRAGGDSNLDDLYVLFKETDPRPAQAALRELSRLPTEKSTILMTRLAKRPQLPVQKLAAEVLLRRHARGSYGVLKGYLEPGTDPQLRGMALVAADDPLLVSLTEDPAMGIWVYRAYLARGDRDHAADWLAAHAPGMSPAQRTDALVEWLESAEPPSPATAKR